MKYTADTLPKNFTFYYKNTASKFAAKVEQRYVEVSGYRNVSHYSVDEALDCITDGFWTNITPINVPVELPAKFYVQPRRGPVYTCETIGEQVKVSWEPRGEYKGGWVMYEKETVDGLLQERVWTIIDEPVEKEVSHSDDENNSFCFGNNSAPNPYVALLPHVYCLMEGENGSVRACALDGTYFILKNEADAQALLNSFLLQESLRGKQK